MDRVSVDRADGPRAGEIRAEVRQVKAAPIERSALLAALRDEAPWDVLIIGGGATGLGIAVDAAARGLRTALIEARDFSSGTSSRSTKLIHGGVRYLAQGNLTLVREALGERARLLANAPELVRPLEFVVPCYRPFEREFMRVGLGVYDALAGAQGIGPTRWLSRSETLACLPGVRERGLHGGVSYWDAQFDDARLAIALMRTAHRLGAVPINYVRVDSMRRSPVDGRIESVRAVDQETGEQFPLRARAVFNATGVWVDEMRALADPAARPMVTVSQGSHIVVDRRFLASSAGMTIPRTADGRVLFAIPWQGRLMIGTTDISVDFAEPDPQPSEKEIEFILEAARGYLESAPSRTDVMASFAGLRPLISAGVSGETRTLSREHSILVEHRNLVSIAGGKWTTYRRMAEDTLDQAMKRGLLSELRCATSDLRLDVDPELERAASDGEAAFVAGLSATTRYSHLSKQFEQTRTADDFLKRRLRIGMTDFRAAALKEIEVTLAG